MTDAFQLTREPDPQEQSDAMIAGHVAEVHTAIPGRIEKVTLGDGGKIKSVDVKPLITRKYTIDNAEGEYVSQTEEYPVIPDVPVAFMRGGGFSIGIPIAKGDRCLLIVAERSLDKYLDSDGASVIDPDDSRRHHLSDAVCYPGMGTIANPAGGTHAENLVIGREDGASHLQITPGGEIQAKCGAFRIGTDAASMALALASAVDSRIGALESAYNAHVHATAAPGPPSPPVPVVIPGSSSASTRAFVDA